MSIKPKTHIHKLLVQFCLSKYDSKGNITQKIYYDANKNITSKEEVRYNEFNNIKEFIKYDSDNNVIIENHIDFEYDSQNNWIKKMGYRNSKLYAITKREICYYE